MATEAEEVAATEVVVTEGAEGEAVDTVEIVVVTVATEVVAEATEEAVEATVEEVSAMPKLFSKALNFVLKDYHVYLSRLRR